MNAGTVYLKDIQDIQRIVRVHTLRRFLENAGLVFLGLLTVYRAINWIGQTMLAGPALFYSAIGLSLICAGVVAWFKKKTLYHRLIEIDANFHLQDRLSTAFEYLQEKKETEFLDLLIQDAEKQISQIDKKKIFPLQISWIHILLGLLILANLLIAAVKNPFITEMPGDIDPNTLDKIRLVIKRYSTEPPKKDDHSKKIATDRIKNRMDGLSNMLENPRIHRERIREMIHKALNEIQSDKIARARDLVEELGLDTVEEVSMQQIQQVDELTRFQLNKLEDMLKRMFDDQIPETIAEDLAVLYDHYRLEAYLEQILDDLGKGNVRQSAPENEGSNDSNGLVPGKNTAPEDGSDMQQNGASTQRLDSNRHAPSAAADRTSGGDDRSQQEMAEDEFEAGPSSAGRGKSGDPSSSPYEPDRLEGLAVQDKTASSQGSEISVLIRSLSAIGKAKEEKQEIVRNYQQAAESILHQENIPLIYKTTIQNYFLSIGLRKEPSSSGRTQ